MLRRKDPSQEMRNVKSSGENKKQSKVRLANGLEALEHFTTNKTNEHSKAMDTIRHDARFGHGKNPEVQMIAEIVVGTYADPKFGNHGCVLVENSAVLSKIIPKLTWYRQFKTVDIICSSWIHLAHIVDQLRGVGYTANPEKVADKDSAKHWDCYIKVIRDGSQICTVRCKVNEKIDLESLRRDNYNILETCVTNASVTWEINCMAREYMENPKAAKVYRMSINHLEESNIRTIRRLVRECTPGNIRKNPTPLLDLMAVVGSVHLNGAEVRQLMAWFNDDVRNRMGGFKYICELAVFPDDFRFRPNDWPIVEETEQEQFNKLRAVSQLAVDVSDKAQLEYGTIGFNQMMTALTTFLQPMKFIAFRKRTVPGSRGASTRYYQPDQVLNQLSMWDNKWVWGEGAWGLHL